MSITADQWLYGQMTGDPAITALVGTRVYSDMAPETATYPLVVFAAQSERPVTGTNAAIHIMDNAVWTVKVCGRNAPYSALMPLADLIRARLNASAGTTVAGRVVACVFENQSRMMELVAGVAYRYIVQSYRIYTQ